MVNKVTLVGYLADAPEIKTSQSGKKIAKLRVGTNEKYKDAQGQYQTKTEWHNLVMFDKTAEIAAQYLVKGSQVYVDGKISYNTYEKDGVKKYFTEIVVHEFKMLGKKESNTTGTDAGNGNAEAYAAATPAAPAKGSAKQQTAPAYQANNKGQNQQPVMAGNPGMDTDDLPF